MKERSSIIEFVNSKTGMIIPHYSIFKSFYLLIRRFGFGDDIFKQIKKQHEELGETFVTFIMGIPIINVTNPSDIREVLSMKDYTKPKGVFTPMLDKYLSDSLIMSNDEPWANQRKAINSALSYSKIKGFISVFESKANILVEKIKRRSKEYFDVGKEFSLMTFDIIGKAGFGFDFNSLEGNNNQYLENMKKVLGNLFSIPSMLFKEKYDNLPLKNNVELKNTCERVDKWIESIIIERKESTNSNEKENNQRKDLLDLILESEKEDKLCFSQKEIHNNIFLFFFAGHDTSSSALTSVFYFLAKYPEYITQAREEVQREINNDEINFDALQKLVLCNSIIKESLRLLPPVTNITARVSTTNVELGGYIIPHPSVFSCVPFMSHFNEKYWEKPNEFNPKRFLEESSKEAQKNAFFPFGYGPRRCPGDKFALAEICVSLVVFLQSFKGWSLKEGWSFDLDGRAHTTKFKKGLPLIFELI